MNIADVNDIAGFARPILTALDATPICSLSPSCVNSRNELQRFADARDSGALDNLADLSNQLESTQGTETLEATTDKLKGLLTKVNSATQSLGGGDVTLNYLDRTLTTSLAILIGATYLLGMITGWTVLGFLRKSIHRVSQAPPRSN